MFEAIQLKALETAWIIILSHNVPGFDKYHPPYSKYNVLDYYLNSQWSSIQTMRICKSKCAVFIVSFAAVFWDDTQCSSKEGGALRDIPENRQSMTACSLLRLLLRI